VTATAARSEAGEQLITPARVGFWLSVFIVLTFSQGWTMIIAGPDGDVSASAAIRNLFVPAYLVGLGLAMVRPWSIAQGALREPLVWVLMAIAAASTFWSVDPDTTSRRALAVIFTALGGLVIATRYDWEELSEVLATSFLILAIASFGVGLLLPRYGVMTELFPGAWRGVFQEKNALGNYMTQGFLIMAAAAVLNPPHRRRWMAGCALAVLLILLSRSKTSLVTVMLAASALTFVGIVRKGGPVVAVLATFAAVTTASALAMAVFLAPDAFFALLGKDATFTGRKQIWEAIERLDAARPLTGYGYGAIWTNKDNWSPLARIVKEAKFLPHEAHSTWLEARLGLGDIGLCAWSALLAGLWVKTLWATYRSRGAYLALPFVAVFSVAAFDESIGFVYNDILWVIFVAIATRLALPASVRADPPRAPA